MKDKLILELYKNKCIEFGNFTLKNGDVSPIYINLKNIISFPYIFKIILSEISDKIKHENYDRLFGVPYGGIPVASCLSYMENKPLIMIRKEIKKHGLKKKIEGEYNENDNIVVIEDTVTTGSSINNYRKIIKNLKLNICKIIAICDRRKIKNYVIDSLFTLNDVLQVLSDLKVINTDLKRELFINENKKDNQIIIENNSFLFNKIISIIKEKKSSICAVTAFTEFTDLCFFIEKHNKRFCVLKIYSDIINNFSYENGKQLKDLSIKYNFLLYEGKFFNTDPTIFFNEITGNCKIYQWVDIIDITFNHNSDIFKSIKYINNKNSKNIGIVYQSSKLNNSIKHLLNNIVIGSCAFFCKNIFRIGYQNKSDIILKNTDNFFLI